MRDRRSSLLGWAGLIVVSAMCLSRLAGFGLAEPDEGRYAEIPREMIELRDWITPHLGYVNYFEKPPLLYWLVGLSFRVFGTSEWAARLVPACAGIVGVIVTHALGVRLFGRRAALLAGAILITSPLYFALSQVLVIDMLLTLCTTGTLLAVHQCHATRNKHAWSIAAAACAALGVLAKGPVALVMPGLVALAFLMQRRDRATLRALASPWPTVVFVAIAMPWFVLVSLSHPDFPYFFLVHENLNRLWSSTVGHPEPFGYYLPVLLGGFFPWTMLVGLLWATHRGRAAARGMAPGPVLFLSLWGGIVVAIFTLARAKLSPYVLPAFPAFALLLGGWLDRALDDPALLRTLTRFARCVAVIAAAVVVMRLALGVVSTSWQASLHGNSGNPQAFLSGGTMLALAMLSAAIPVVRRRNIERIGNLGTLLLLIAGVACGQVAAVGARGALETSRNVALAVDAIRGPGDTVVAYGKVMQGLSFYTAERVIQAARNGMFGELQFGASSAPDATDFFWIGRRPLSERWRSGPRMFIVTEDDCEAGLAALLDPPPRVLARDGSRVVLVNFSPVSREAAAPVLKPARTDASRAG